jgi:hypothetical protein
MTLEQMVELLDELHFLERQAASIASKLANLEPGWRYTLKLIRCQINYARRCRDLERPELVASAEAILRSGVTVSRDRTLVIADPFVADDWVTTVDVPPGRVH